MAKVTQISTVTLVEVDKESRIGLERGDFANPDRAMVILMEEVGEASQRVLEMGRSAHLLDSSFKAYQELIQVASVALRLADQIKENRWPTKLS